MKTPFRSVVLVACTFMLAACMGSDGTEYLVPTNQPPAVLPGPGPSPSPSPSPSPTLSTAALQWDAVTASDLAGYRVYFGTAPRTYAQSRGQGLEAGRTPSYTVHNLQRGVTYYFAVTSYDFAGNESPYSAEVSKRIE